MALASRGLRDLDDGAAPFAGPDRERVRSQARRVHRRAALAAVLLTAATLLIPA